MNPLVQRWQSLASRERASLCLLGLFLSGVLVWTMLFKPFQLRLAQAELAWQREQGVAARLAHWAPAALPEQPLSASQLSDLAQQAGLQIQEWRLTGNVLQAHATGSAAAVQTWLQGIDASGNPLQSLELQRLDEQLEVRWQMLLADQ
jgi:general secretion pathway protein M